LEKFMRRIPSYLAAGLALALVGVIAAQWGQVGERIRWAACGYKSISSRATNYCYITRAIYPSEEVVYLSPHELKMDFISRGQTPSAEYRVGLLIAKIRNNMSERDLTDLSMDVRLMGGERPIDAVAYSTGAPRIAPGQLGEVMLQLVTPPFEGDGADLGKQAILIPKMATFHPHFPD
jgi:hypothetical protein